VITLGEIEQRVSALRCVNDNSAEGHIEEDEIREDALKAIAAGAENPQELALAALKTGEYHFPRWYERGVTSPPSTSDQQCAWRGDPPHAGDHPQHRYC